MGRNSLLCPVILVSVIAGLSTVALIFQFNSLFHDLPSFDVSPGIELGSDAYYALTSTRKRLINEVQNTNNALQDELKIFSATSLSSEKTARALMGYLPPNDEKFISELKWFYLSIGKMRSTQPENIKTDLIIFTESSYADFVASEFKCKRTLRTSFADPQSCIVIAHVPLKNRKTRLGEPQPPLVEYANYIDSMLVLAEFPTRSAYDFLLRSDLDTFVTPGFSNWTLPSDVAIAVGSGGYGSENANRHLSWTMVEKLGLKDEGLKGLGSTWYGRSSVMIAAAKLTVATMNWLHTQEFSEYEQFHSGTDGWPFWHWPVLLLYGGHIALNQVPLKQIVKSTDGVMELDKGTGGTTPMTAATKHLHCYHGEEFFSKFKFYAGQYKDMDISQYSAMESTQSYAAVLAISSSRLSASEISSYLANKETFEGEAWKRLKPA